ncbi:MAG: hypothetical protein R3Y58_13725 [Eubacteriales bacterium]
MFALMIALYIVAAILGIIALKLYLEYRKTEKFGNVTSAKVTFVDDKGKGVFTKYQADISYKIDKKKYKAKVESGFEHPLIKNSEINIRYNPLNPQDVIVKANEAYKLFLVIGLILMIIANFI